MPDHAPIPCSFGPALQPYWDRRHTLFAKFDEGIQTDAKGLYSVTPEAVALDIARAGKKVIAVELDAQRLDYGPHYL